MALILASGPWDPHSQDREGGNWVTGNLYGQQAPVAAPGPIIEISVSQVVNVESTPISL